MKKSGDCHQNKGKWALHRKNKQKKPPIPKRGELLKTEFWFHGKGYDNELVI